jgi:acetate kinase
MLTIIVNNGSTSKRYGLFNGTERLYGVYYENTPKGYVKTEYKNDVEKKEIEITEELFVNSFDDLIKTMLKNGLIKSEDDIQKVALRVVAPGKYFQEHRKIDKEFLEKLDDKYSLSPLHIGPVQKEIVRISQVLPKVPKFSISDSAFHKNKPNYANVYAYPLTLTEDLELYRYGYHGISYSSITNRLKEQNRLPKKLIVCHLGGGSSISAIENGISIDTTMGYSPLEGMPMATRIGYADPNSMIAVMTEKDLDAMELQDFLYNQSGVKGISQTNGDTREILKRAQEGDEKSELALEVYSYQAAKFIGSFITVMGGLDMLVFTGTIGNRSADVRDRICKKIKCCGLEIDQQKNKMTIATEQTISANNSKIEVLVLSTDEIGEMARIVSDL